MGNQQLPAYMRGRSTRSGPITGGYQIITAGPYDSGDDIAPVIIRIDFPLYVVEFGWHAEGTVAGNPTIEPVGRVNLGAGSNAALINSAIDLGTTPSGVATFDTTQTYYIDPSSYVSGVPGKGDFMRTNENFLRITQTLGGGSFADLFIWLVCYPLTHTALVTEGLSTLEREKL